MPHDSAIPLLGTYPDKTLIRKDTCTPMLTAHYSQQPRLGSDLTVQSADGRIEKLRFILTMALLVTKKRETTPFAATPLQLEITY